MSRVDPGVHGKLKELVDEFKDVFPDTLPKGRPPKKDIVHEIRTKEGAKPPSRPPYRLGPAEQYEMEEQVKDLLAQGFIRPSASPYGALSCLSPKRTAGGACALTTGPSTNRLCKTNSRCLALIPY